MASISNRRGSTANDSKFGILKLIFISALFLLVLFLINLNYQLMIALGRDNVIESPVTSVETPLSAVPMTQTDHNKINSLRKEISITKEQVDSMKSLVNAMKQQPNSAKQSGTTNMNPLGELSRINCSPTTKSLQTSRSSLRFSEWWSHSACPDQPWISHLHSLISPPYLILDIGCNKGYTSADFFDALSPGTGINPSSLLNAIRAVAAEDGTTYDRMGGVCNDADKPLNTDTSSRPMEVHCFEPSPATYHMLTRVKDRLAPRGEAKWHIHNLGMHEVPGEMAWHPSCRTSVGDELCTIVAEGTADSIPIPVVTVDSFLEDFYGSTSPPLVHVLKIDAEGLDPAVLVGAAETLKKNRAMMVMFEFNPQLGNGETPHGMWGPKGDPHRDLLEVTDWLDSLGYDCYLESRVPQGKEVGKVEEAPALYRITGDCLEEPKVRGWANVVCGSRKWGSVTGKLRELASLVE